MSINTIPGLLGKLEYSTDGSAFVPVPGVENISLSGGEAPESDVVTFQGVGKVVGHPRVPSVSATVSAYNPQHAAWRAISSAGRDRQALTWRFISQKEVFYTASGSANTVAIARNTGAVTFAGDAPDFTSGQFAPGMVLDIRTGGDLNPTPRSTTNPDNVFIINEIDDDGDVTVKPAPKSVVKATAGYRVINPSLRLGPFIAAVRSIGNVEMSAEGQLTTTLELSPRSQIPDWVIV